MRLEEHIKYYREFRNDVWLLMKKYEEAPELKELYMRLVGKIEGLEEGKSYKKEEEEKIK